MTRTDDQLDAELRQAMEDRDAPAPREAAKRAAIIAARREFEALHPQQEEQKQDFTQGLSGWLRHIVGNASDKGRAIMPFSHKAIYTGITAAAVGAVAVGISLQYQPWEKSTDDARLYPELLEERELAVTDNAGGGSDTIMKMEMSSAPEPGAARLREDKKDLAEGLESHTGGAARKITGVAAESAAAPATAARQQSQPGPVANRRGIAADHDVMPGPHYQEVGRDAFRAFEQNRVKLVSEDPVSTFSADVDTASYSFVRRMLNSGVLPQGDAVRAEELINYFDYDYPLPESRTQPFQPTVAVSDAPWAAGRKLLHIGIKGYDIEPADKPRTNLVFLLDVSGSMNSPDKLPLVKQSVELLLTTLDPEDTVAIAVYAGAAGTVLEPTPVKDRHKILAALRQLSAGGSTAGAQGIRLAYELARLNFDQGAINRVILATDGDFNVGITDQRELQSFIERKREEGILLSVLGFGQGNYHDALMQTLAQNGNGVAAYIDTLSEAQKVLVDESTSTLFPIAGDVKFQVEFNPATVAEYRLIGYETRHLNREDFNNDAVDAGDIGAGHSVTAIYEFTPVTAESRQIEDRRYAPEAQPGDTSGEYAFLKIRYKLPGESRSRLITQPVEQDALIELGGDGIAAEAGFSTAVAAFAQLLKGGKYTGGYHYDDIIALAQRSRGDDPYGYRTEFIQLVRKARTAAAMQVR